MNPKLEYILGTLALAVLCFVSGAIGISLKAIGGIASPLLWVPAPLSLAVCLLYGLRWWPGVALGLIALGLALERPFAMIFSVVTSDVIELFVAVLLLRGVLGMRHELDRVRDVVAFLVVVLAVSLLGATLAIGSLVAIGDLGVDRAPQIWMTWWWSHLSGYLVITPTLLTSVARSSVPRVRQTHRSFEAVALSITTLLVVLLVLGQVLPVWLPQSHAPYYLLPMLLWAGIRFGPRGAALASFGVCVTAFIAQTFGLGLFSTLFELQSFVAISTATALLLSALALERVRAVERKGAIELAALDGIVTITESGRVLEINPAAERMFLLREGDAIGKDLASLVIPPNLRGAYYRALHRYLRSSKGSSGGTRYRTTARRALDGAEFPVEVAVTRLQVDGQTVFTGFIRDRTKEEVAAQALREAHEQLERKVEERTADLKAANLELERRESLMMQAEELAHLGSFEYDVTNGSLKWSDELFDIYGRDPRTFQPTMGAYLDAVLRDDRPRVQAQVQSAIEHVSPYGFEERIVRPDGSVRVLQTIARVYGDGTRATRIAGCCQDITERKRAESARSRLVQLVESSDDAILGITEDSTIETWNAAAAKMFEYSASDVVGKHCAMLVPSDERGRVNELLEAVRAGEHVAHYEMRLRRSNGTLFDGSVTLSAVLDDAGRVVGMSKVIRDVSDQRRVEEQLRSSLREKEVLLREIHHRVKNNLQVIASLLNMQVSAQGSDARKGLVESQDRIHSMALVHQLLYQSKDLAVIDFGEYLTKLTNRLAQTYSAAPARILVHVSATDVGLDIDRAIPCGLIVNELVTNALTHAFPAGRKGEIAVDLRQDGDSLVLTVADNGVGMDPDIRIEDVQTFGLRIARTLTLQLGGTIEVSREHGTRVRVTFPAVPHKPAQGSN